MPDEWGGVLVPVFDPVGDVGGEGVDGVVGGALQFLGGERREPAFGGDLELVLLPRFQSERPPDLRHRLMRDPVLGGQRPRRPMRRIRRGRLQRVDHDLLDEIIGDRPLCAGTRFVDQPVETPLGEPLAPLRHRRRVAADLGGDLATGQIGVLAEQHDLAAHRQRLRTRVPARPTLQLSALIAGELNLDRGSSSSGHRCSPPMLAVTPARTRHRRENSRSQRFLG